MTLANYQRLSVKTEGEEDIYTFHGCQCGDDGKTLIVDHRVPHGAPPLSVLNLFADRWPDIMAEFGDAS